MTTLEDTIKQYEQRLVKTRRNAIERIQEIEKHIEKLKARLEKLQRARIKSTNFQITTKDD